MSLETIATVIKLTTSVFQKPVHLLWSRLGKNRRLQDRLDQLVQRMRHCQAEHMINVELGYVRAFFLDNSLLKRPGVAGFYGKWIEPYEMVIGVPGSNCRTLVEITEMIDDLEKIKL